MNKEKKTRLHIIIMAAIEIIITVFAATYAWNTVIAETFLMPEIAIWHVWAFYFVRICFFGLSSSEGEIEEPEVKIISGVIYKLIAVAAIWFLVTVGWI